MNYRIGEVTDGPSRIYFNPESSEANFALSEFTFITTDTPSCEDVVVYSKVITTVLSNVNIIPLLVIVLSKHDCHYQTAKRAPFLDPLIFNLAVAQFLLQFHTRSHRLI